MLVTHTATKTVVTQSTKLSFRFKNGMKILKANAVSSDAHRLQPKHSYENLPTDENARQKATTFCVTSQCQDRLWTLLQKLKLQNCDSFILQIP
jgi:hypothetical protein